MVECIPPGVDPWRDVFYTIKECKHNRQAGLYKKELAGKEESGRIHALLQSASPLYRRRVCGQRCAAGPSETVSVKNLPILRTPGF